MKMKMKKTLWIIPVLLVLLAVACGGEGDDDDDDDECTFEDYCLAHFECVDSEADLGQCTSTLSECLDAPNYESCLCQCLEQFTSCGLLSDCKNGCRDSLCF